MNTMESSSPTLTRKVIQAIFIYKSNDLPFDFQFPYDEESLQHCSNSELRRAYQELYSLYLKAGRSHDNRVFVRDEGYGQTWKKDSYEYPILMAQKQKERAEELMTHVGSLLQSSMMTSKSPDQSSIEAVSSPSSSLTKTKLKSKHRKAKQIHITVATVQKTNEDMMIEEINQMKKERQMVENNVNGILVELFWAAWNCCVSFAESHRVELDEKVIPIILMNIHYAIGIYFSGAIEGQTENKSYSSLTNTPPHKLSAMKKWVLEFNKDFYPKIMLDYFGISKSKHFTRADFLPHLNMEDGIPFIHKEFILQALDKLNPFSAPPENMAPLVACVSPILYIFLADFCFKTIQASEDSLQRVHAKRLIRKIHNHSVLKWKAIEEVRQLFLKNSFGDNIVISPFHNWRQLNDYLSNDKQYFAFYVFHDCYTK